MNEVQQTAFELRLDDLEKLVRHGADKRGLLLAACSAHDPDSAVQRTVIRYLLEADVPIDETDKNGVTPLHRAVRFRSPGAVELLIQEGADVNAADRRSGSTPLHRAVTNTGAPATARKDDEVAQIVELLLRAGADVGRRNKQGKLPIDYVRRTDLAALFADSTEN